MRHAWYALVTVAMVTGWHCENAKAEEARSRWWPFGAKSTPAPESSPGTPTTLQKMPPGGPAAADAPPLSESASPSAVDPTLGAAPSGMPLEEEPSWMIRSPFARVSWPRIQLPEVHLPRPQLWPRKTEVDDVRNAWLGEDNEPARPSPLQAAKQGAHRVAESTRSAWRKTVDVFTPGDPADASGHIAQQETRPSLWRRMFAMEEPQPEGPRTVTEWMAQDRLDP